MQDASDSTPSGACDSEQPVSAPPAPRRGRPLKKAAQRGAYSFKHSSLISTGLSECPISHIGQEICQTQSNPAQACRPSWSCSDVESL